MKAFILLMFGFLFGMVIAGIRMTDDKKSNEILKVKRINDGVVSFIPKDDDFPYSIGDMYEDRKNTDVGLMVIQYVVIDDIKTK